jgi:CBS domain containing-hemolysin-like protein
LGLLSVVLAILEYGWQNLSRTRLAHAGEGPASRERLLKLLSEADRAETALIVLRVGSQIGLVLVLILLARERLPVWWPELQAPMPTVLACGAAFLWITFFCRLLPGELSVRVLEGSVRATMPLMVVLGRLVAPPFELYRKMLRIVTGATQQGEAELYADEILATIEEGEREGHLAEHQADMIEHILALQRMEVRKLMTPHTDVNTIDVAGTVGQARQVAQSTGRSRYPVVEGDVDRVVGIVHVKDLLNQVDEQPVRDVMRPPWFVPESKFITELLAEFRHHRTHLAVVLDEYGGTSGVITIEDVLEEIVGEIEDEFDAHEEPDEVQVLDERHALVPGSMRVDEVNATLSIAIPESDDYDTVGGYIFSTLGRLPDEGEELRHENLVLTVRRVVERRVDLVALEILQPVG